MYMYLYLLYNNLFTYTTLPIPQHIQGSSAAWDYSFNTPLTPEAELAPAASRSCSLLWQVVGLLNHLHGDQLKCVTVPNQPFCLWQAVSAPCCAVLCSPQPPPMCHSSSWEGFTTQSQSSWQQQTGGFLGQNICLLFSTFYILFATENRST